MLEYSWVGGVRGRDGGGEGRGRGSNAVATGKTAERAVNMAAK
jgi:hypothetical protein